MGQALGCIQVDESTVAIKENFGKYDDVLGPGFHFMPCCFGSQLAGYLSLRVQQLDIRCESKTKDNVFVTLVASIQYRALADKAADAFYKLSNTKEQIQAYVFDESSKYIASLEDPTQWYCQLILRATVIRATVPTLELDQVFEQKTEIAKAVGKQLTKAMSLYGYEIVQTLIVDVEPDDQVKSSMNEINAASRLRQAAYEKAEGEKILQIMQAEGEAESKYLAGLGIARQRQAIVEGLKASVIGFSTSVPGASTKDVMDMILITQYFDTMKEISVSPNSSAVFIPHEPEDATSEQR